MSEYVGADRVSRKHLGRYLETKASEHQEDVAREKQRFGEIRPREAQLSSRTSKSDSRIRFTTEAYRRGYEGIFGK